MQLDSRQIKILQEMGIPMSGFALLKNSSKKSLDEQIGNTLHSPNANTPFTPHIDLNTRAGVTAPNSPVVISATTANEKRGSKLKSDIAANQTYTAIDASSINALGWSELEEAVTSCQACSLSTTRQRVVWGSQIDVQSNKAASKPLELIEELDWLVIDHCPTDLEDQTGNPLSSDAGQLLFNMLKALCLDDQFPLAPGSTSPSKSVMRSISIINAVKCHPPGGRNPDGFETNQCKVFLQRQIELLKPKGILILGLPAYKAVYTENAINESADSSGTSTQDLKTPPLTQLRNEVLHLFGIPAFITYHPGSLLLHPQDKSKSWQDLIRAQAYLARHEKSNQIRN